MRATKTFSLVAMLLPLAGCVTGYTLVAAGPYTVDTLQVDAGSGWNAAPPTYGARKTAQSLTRDGLLLDRVVFIPAVADGEPLLAIRDESLALPVFRKDMLPNEIEELAESTFVKEFGEGNAVLTTSNLRPQMYGEHRGVMFDIEAKVTESPDYRGMVGAFIVGEKLYFMYYMAAEPYYYGKHKEKAEAMIKSARLASSPPAQ